MEPKLIISITLISLLVMLIIISICVTIVRTRQAIESKHALEKVYVGGFVKGMDYDLAYRSMEVPDGEIDGEGQQVTIDEILNTSLFETPTPNMDPDINMDEGSDEITGYYNPDQDD